MENFTLTSNDIQELRVAHRSALKMNSSKSAYKINVIILLGSDWTVEEVSEALLLDEETVRDYGNRYKQFKLDGLLNTRHKGSETKLNDSQIQELIIELEKTIHLTTQSVINFVENTFGIQYTQSGMRDLLHRLDYVYKKPKLVPGDPDTEAQEIFAEQYEEFMETKPRNEEVVFLDAVHPEHNTLASYGWIKRGEKRELKTNSGRERLNLHGAINAETYQVSIIESETVNGESTIDLLTAIESAYPAAKKIHVILDNAKYHYSKLVREFIENSRINLVFLPSYSPNLNLIERLWKFFKKKVLYNTYYENIDAFRKACIYFFRNIDNHHEEIHNFMSGEFDIAY